MIDDDENVSNCLMHLFFHCIFSLLLTELVRYHGKRLYFQQNGVPHAVHIKQSICYAEKRRTSFRGNSPDLHPADYQVQATIQYRVYPTKITDVCELRQRLLNVWHATNQHVINAYIDWWHEQSTIGHCFPSLRVSVCLCVCQHRTEKLLIINWCNLVS